MGAAVKTELKHGQLPLSLGDTSKRDVRTQFAALCYRRVKSKTKVLPITSRDTGRWGLPKGWPMDDLTPVETAMTEAWEEAGIRGTADLGCVGIYSYDEELDTGTVLAVVVAVFSMPAGSIADTYREAGERVRKWVSPKKAARLVDEPDLAVLLRGFKP